MIEDIIGVREMSTSPSGDSGGGGGGVCGGVCVCTPHQARVALFLEKEVPSDGDTQAEEDDAACVELLVKWKGRSHIHATWHGARELAGAAAAAAAAGRRHPMTPMTLPVVLYAPALCRAGSMKSTGSEHSMPTMLSFEHSSSPRVTSWMLRHERGLRGVRGPRARRRRAAGAPAVLAGALPVGEPRAEEDAADGRGGAGDDEGGHHDQLRPHRAPAARVSAAGARRATRRGAGARGRRAWP